MPRTFPRRALLMVLLAAPALLGTRSCERDPDPIVFVHGFFGSGAQFESQAMRFASNGYAPEAVGVVEYNSALPFPASFPLVHALIDAKIAELLDTTGHDQVVLVGHSLGTSVSHDYLSFPDRAAKVSHYVNIDGRSADAPPGGVPTLALWAGAVERPVPGEIVGAVNVTLANQEHVEAATSPEAFFEMFSFLHGHPPLTTKILPELRPRVAGRVMVFPDNAGADGATVNVWRIRRDTAERVWSHPQESFEVGPDGAFGPFHAWYGARYELEVLREGTDIAGRDLLPSHFYYEPFVRSDSLVRLNTSPALEGLLPRSADRTGLGILRYKEFWGDRGAENDALSIDGVNVVNATNAPSGEVGEASVGFFVLDEGTDGVTDLDTVPFPFGPLPFLTGADLVLATDPPDPIAIVTVPRGKLGAARALTVRNIPSTEGLTQVQLRDFER
jgi:pimeloyl-ACP methyl ester carboxylesterase